MTGFRGWAQDASGAVADLGVLAPITAALVIRNGLDPATVLVGVGALYVGAGWYFRVPTPVQPIKAAAAIAIARGLPPEELATAGIVLGVLLLVLAASGAANWLASIFAIPIVRGLQLGIGLILIRTATQYASDAGGIACVVGAGGIALLLVATTKMNYHSAALGVLFVAIMYSLATSGTTPRIEFALWRPELNPAASDLDVIWSALVLLVIPQIPLTLGNAVVAVVDLERRYYPSDAHRVNARSVSLSSGLANVCAGAFTGMPMCHGSGGLTAHYRAGARTYRMNLIIGSALLALGLFFGPSVLLFISLIPATVLAGFLAFTGLFHSSLAASMRGSDLAVATIMGAAALLTTNLLVALAMGLALYRPLTTRRSSESKG